MGDPYAALNLEGYGDDDASDDAYASLDLEGYNDAPEAEPAAPAPQQPEPTLWQKFVAVGKSMAGLGGAAPKMEGLGAAMATGAPRTVGRGTGAPVMDPATSDAMAYVDAQEEAQGELSEASATPMGVDKAAMYRRFLSMHPMTSGAYRVADAAGVAPFQGEDPLTAGDTATAAGMALTAPYGMTAAAPTVGGRVVQAVAQGGLPAAVTEAAQSDAETPSEFIDDVGTAGAVGTGIGVAMSEAPRVLAAAKRGVGRLASRSGEHLAGEFGDPELAARARDMSDPLSETGAAARAKALRGSDPARLEAHQEQVIGDLNTIGSGGDMVRGGESIAKKGEWIREAMLSEGVAPPLNVADDVVQALDDRITSELVDNEVARDRTALNKARRAIATFRNRMESITDPADHYMALDQLKRDLQEQADLAVSRRGGAGVSSMFEGMADDLRIRLEDAGTWGEQAAAVQVPRNRAWRERLRATRKAMERKLFREGADDSAQTAYRGAPEVDEPAAMSVVEGAGEMRGRQAMGDVMSYADTEAELQRALVAQRAADDPLAVAAGESRLAADRMSKTLQQRAEEGAAAGEMQRIQQLAGEARPGILTRGLERVGVPVRELRGDVASRTQSLAKLEAAAPMSQSAQRELDAMKALARSARKVRGWADTQVPASTIQAMSALRPGAAIAAQSGPMSLSPGAALEALNRDPYAFGEMSDVIREAAERGDHAAMERAMTRVR